MATPRWRTGKVPRHRAAGGVRWAGGLSRHQWYAALAAVGAVALTGGVLLLPGHSAPSAASGCGLVTCTSRRVTPAVAAGESSASLRGARPAPARATPAPAQPGGSPRARPTPSPSPSQLAPHHGQANGLTHRRHGHWAGTG